MKTVRLTQPGKPLELQEVEISELQTDQILVRVKAAGICHSDAHYRAGTAPSGPLPLTLGHEVSGIVEQVGSTVTGIHVGSRVCLHYLVTCGRCDRCKKGQEQFCSQVQMLGKHRDGGFAEFIVVPAKNAFLLPDGIPFEQGAIMMCSTATAYHAIQKGRLQPGETLAVFGCGGLGISALQLAGILGAGQVFVVDINPLKLELAHKLGAIPINALDTDPVIEIQRHTGGLGVDMALEFIGLPQTIEQSIRSLGFKGRAVIAGISSRPAIIDTYADLINKEAQIIGVSDHLSHEIHQLIRWVHEGVLDLSFAVAETIPLESDLVNRVLDNLVSSTASVRTVITP